MKTVRQVVRYSKKHPFIPATAIKDELNVEASVETVRRCLQNNGLNDRSPRKVPLLTKKHAQKRLKFAKEHLTLTVEEWRNILWSPESKIILYGRTGSRSYVRRSQNTEYKPTYTNKTIKHEGCSIMIWASFSYYGVGPIYWIKGNMDKHLYVQILQDVMLPDAAEEMPLIWVFQQDNDPKHTTKLAKEWLKSNDAGKGMACQSPDLNPIENLWTDVKKVVAQRHPTSFSQQFRRPGHQYR